MFREVHQRICEGGVLLRVDPCHQRHTPSKSNVHFLHRNPPQSDHGNGNPTPWHKMDQHNCGQRRNVQPPATSVTYPNLFPVDPSARPLESRPKSQGIAENRLKETFSCQQCSKVFNRRENLSRHIKTHDASPSHCCEKCGKGFSRSDLLRRHEAGHERWDRKGIDDESTKRRKVDVDVQPSSMPPPSSWISATMNHDLPLQKTQDSSFSSGSNLASAQPTSTGQHFGHPEVFPGSYQLNSGQSPDFQARSHLNQIWGQGQDSGSSHRDCRKEGRRYDIQDHSFTQYPTANEMAYDYHQFGSMDTSSIPFDFSSFLLPADIEALTENGWFSSDFYSAMRETGDWAGFGDTMIPNSLNTQQEYANWDETQHPPGPLPIEPPSEASEQGETRELSDEDQQTEERKFSLGSSPPNEASEDDKWPFQWNPSSTPILQAHAITIPDNHPLFQAHYSRFDITETTLLRLRAFLKPPSGREYHRSQKGSFVLPSLPVVNVFVRLFFESFSPQMPVLHHATIDTNNDLPAPLLAAIIIIGAIYSHFKHTRRFAIVLLDIVRWHLQIAIECDNSLMRDPMIIYAEALICHAGLWCGNKRAFELAEVVRGSLVTHMRRVQFGERLVMSESAPTPSERLSNLSTKWREWVAEESRRRLAWVVYVIDCHFPSILNLPSTISIGEVCNLGCPCDDEFWFATSAKNWKNLLGQALVPSSRSFSAAVGPFILETLIPNPSADKPSQGSERTVKHLPALDLNPWSAFLALLAIQSQIFEFSQESLITRTFIDDGESSDVEEGSGHESEHTDHSSAYNDMARMLKKLKSQRRLQFADALDSWTKAYQNPSRSNTHMSSRHFHASSVIVHHLSTILLDISLSDLQAAIGKEGAPGSKRAFAKLTKWARKSPQLAEHVVSHAIETIILLAPGKDNGEAGIRNIDTAPYSLITIFLCHIIVWAFAKVATAPQKLRFLETISKNREITSTAFFTTLKRSFAFEGHGKEASKTTRQGSDRNGNGEEAVLFRSAAEMLIRLGTWGCALNLALLLHERAKM